MRNELAEPGRGTLRRVLRRDATPGAALPALGAALPALAVDAALADDAEPLVAQRPTRREVATCGSEAAHVSLDVAHEGAAESAPDRNLLRQLSRQLTLLEIQQGQIRRLLQQTEQRAANVASAGESR